MAFPQYPEKSLKSIHKKVAMQNSASKLQISESVMQVWQDFLDVLTQILNVPVALIMKWEEPYISVLLSSDSKGNPYHPGDKEIFQNSGLYCERVIKTKSHLLVPNALADPDWDHNPDIKLGMISYLGYPIMKPDGKAFGTLCILDNKENPYSAVTQRLMEHYRNMIQREIAMEYFNLLLGKENASLNDYIRNLQDKNEIILKHSEQLQSMNTELNSKIETLNWLIKVITHDLRGPLGSFRDLLQMLLTQNIPETEHQEVLQLIYERSGKMYNIVNEILDSVKLQSIRLDDLTDIRRQNILPIISSIYDLYQPIAAQKFIDFDFVSPAESIPAAVDQNLLKIAVRNLLNNAVKYSQAKSKICLELRVQNSAVEIIVKDEGIGIKADDLSYLREGLQQTESHDYPDLSLGLGLKLCQDCIHRLHGTLAIESEPGQGASFIIRIPANLAQKQ
jgi:signal transduction histidine kinase